MTVFLITLIAITFLLALYIFLIAPSHDGERMPSCLLTSYAHRGLHSDSIPENSMAAFEKACEKGFGIELDIRLTSDGKVVVFHDDTLLRMCGIDINVSSLTYEELSSYTLKGSDEKIPLFSDVLTLVDGKVPLLVELKGENLDNSLCDAAFELLDLYGGAFCVESFNPILIGYVKEKRPAYIRGQLVTKLKKAETTQPFHVRFLLSHMMLNMISRPHFIAFDKKEKPSLAILISTWLLGAKKFAWTVRSFDEYRCLKESGTLSIFEKFDPSEENKR